MVGQGTQCTVVVLQALIHCKISVMCPVSFSLLAGEAHGQILGLRTLKWHWFLPFSIVIFYTFIQGSVALTCWGWDFDIHSASKLHPKNEELNTASLGRCEVSYLSCVGVTLSICAVFPQWWGEAATKIRYREVAASMSDHDQVNPEPWKITRSDFWTSWNSSAGNFESHASSLNYLKVCCKGDSLISPNICNSKGVCLLPNFLAVLPPYKKTHRTLNSVTNKLISSQRISWKLVLFS